METFPKLTYGGYIDIRLTEDHNAVLDNEVDDALEDNGHKALSWLMSNNFNVSIQPCPFGYKVKANNLNDVASTGKSYYFSSEAKEIPAGLAVCAFRAALFLEDVLAAIETTKGGSSKGYR